MTLNIHYNTKNKRYSDLEKETTIDDVIPY